MLNSVPLAWRTMSPWVPTRSPLWTYWESENQQLCIQAPSKVWICVEMITRSSCGSSYKKGQLWWLSPFGRLVPLTFLPKNVACRNFRIWCPWYPRLKGYLMIALHWCFLLSVFTSLPTPIPENSFPVEMISHNSLIFSRWFIADKWCIVMSGFATSSDSGTVKVRKNFVWRISANPWLVLLPNRYF